MENSILKNSRAFEREDRSASPRNESSPLHPRQRWLTSSLYQPLINRTRAYILSSSQSNTHSYPHRFFRHLRIIPSISPMSEESCRQLQTGSHEQSWPVDCMEAEDILSHLRSSSVVVRGRVVMRRRRIMLGMVTSHKKGMSMHDDETMVGACSRKVHTWSVTFQRDNGGGGGGACSRKVHTFRFDKKVRGKRHNLCRERFLAFKRKHGQDFNKLVLSCFAAVPNE